MAVNNFQPIPQIQQNDQDHISITVLQGATFTLIEALTGLGHLILQPESHFITTQANLALLQQGENFDLHNIQVEPTNDGLIDVMNISGHNLDFTINHQ